MQNISLRSWVLAVLVVIAAVLTSYVSLGRATSTFEGSLSFDIQAERNISAPSSVLLDTGSENRLVVGTVSGWLSDPGVISSIFTRAEVSFEGASMADLSQTFEVNKVASDAAVITLTYASSDQDKVSKVLAATQEEIAAKQLRWNEQAQLGVTSPSLSAEPGAVIVSEVHGAKKTAPYAALAVGVLLAALVIVVSERSGTARRA